MPSAPPRCHQRHVSSSGRRLPLQRSRLLIIRCVTTVTFIIIAATTMLGVGVGVVTTAVARADTITTTTSTATAAQPEVKLPFVGCAAADGVTDEGARGGEVVSTPLVLALPTGVLFAPVAFLYGPHRASAFPPLKTVTVDASTGAFDDVMAAAARAGAGVRPPPTGNDRMRSSSSSSSSSSNNGTTRSSMIACRNVTRLRLYLPNTAMMEVIPPDMRNGGPDTGGPTAEATGTCTATSTNTTAKNTTTTTATVDAPFSSAETQDNTLPPTSRSDLFLGAAAAVVVDPSKGMVCGPGGGLQPYAENGVPIGTVSDRWWRVLDLAALAHFPPPSITRNGGPPPFTNFDNTNNNNNHRNDNEPQGDQETSSWCLLEAFAQGAADGNQSDAKGHFPMTLLGHTEVAVNTTTNAPNHTTGMSMVTVPVARLTGLLLIYANDSSSSSSRSSSHKTAVGGGGWGGVLLCGPSATNITDNTTTTSVLFTPANYRSPSLASANSRAFLPLTACSQGPYQSEVVVDAAALVVGYNNVYDVPIASSSAGIISQPPNPPMIFPSRAYTDAGIRIGSPVGRGPYDNNSWAALATQMYDPRATDGYLSITSAQFDGNTNSIAVCVADIVALSVGGGPNGGNDFYSIFPSDAIVSLWADCLAMNIDATTAINNILTVTTVLNYDTVVTLTWYTQNPVPTLNENAASLMVLNVGACNAAATSSEGGDSPDDGDNSVIFPFVCPWTYVAPDLNLRAIEEEEEEGKERDEKSGKENTSSTSSSSTAIQPTSSRVAPTTKTTTILYGLKAAGTMTTTRRVKASMATVLGVLPPAPQCTPLATFLASFASIAADFSGASVLPGPCQNVVSPPTPRDLFGTYSSNLAYNFLQGASDPSVSPILLLPDIWQTNLLGACAGPFTPPFPNSADHQEHQPLQSPLITSATWRNVSDPLLPPSQRRPLTDAEALCAFAQFITGAPNVATMAVQWSCAADGSGTVFMSSCNCDTSASPPPPPLPWAPRWRQYVNINPSAGRYVTNGSSHNSSNSHNNNASSPSLWIPPYFADNSGGLPLIAVHSLLTSSIAYLSANGINNAAAGAMAMTAGDLSSVVAFRCSVCRSIGLEPGMAPLPYALVVASALKDAVVIALGVWIFSQPRPRKLFASFVANISTVLIPLRDPALTAGVRASVQRTLAPASIAPSALIDNFNAFMVWAAQTQHPKQEEALLGQQHRQQQQTKQGGQLSHQEDEEKIMKTENENGGGDQDEGEEEGIIMDDEDQQISDPLEQENDICFEVVSDREVQEAAFAVYFMLYVMRGGQRCIRLSTLDDDDDDASSFAKLTEATTETEKTNAPWKRVGNAAAVADVRRLEISTRLATVKALFGLCLAERTRNHRHGHRTCSHHHGHCRNSNNSTAADLNKGEKDFCRDFSAIDSRGGGGGGQPEPYGATEEAPTRRSASQSTIISGAAAVIFPNPAVCYSPAQSKYSDADEEQEDGWGRHVKTRSSWRMRHHFQCKIDAAACTADTCLLRTPTPHHCDADADAALLQSTRALWASLEARQALHPVIFTSDMIDRRITPPAWLLCLHVLYVLVLFSIHATSVFLGKSSDDDEVVGGLLGSPWARYQSFYFRFVNSTTVVGLLVDALLRVWYSPPLPPSLDVSPTAASASASVSSSSSFSADIDAIVDVVTQNRAKEISKIRRTMKITQMARTMMRMMMTATTRMRMADTDTTAAIPVIKSDAEGDVPREVDEFGDARIDDGLVDSAACGGGTTPGQASSSSPNTAIILDAFLFHLEQARTPTRLLWASLRDPFVIIAVLLPLPVLLTHALPGIVLYAWVVGPLTAAMAAVALVPSQLVPRLLRWWRRMLRRRNRRRRMMAARKVCPTTCSSHAAIDSTAAARVMEANNRAKRGGEGGWKEEEKKMSITAFNESFVCDDEDNDTERIHRILQQQTPLLTRRNTRLGQGGSFLSVYSASGFAESDHVCADKSNGSAAKITTVAAAAAAARDSCSSSSSVCSDSLHSGDRCSVRRSGSNSSSASAFWIVVARLVVRVVLTIVCTLLIQSSVNWMVLAYSGGGQSRVRIPNLWKLNNNVNPTWPPVVNTVPNTFLFSLQFPPSPPPNPSDPTDAARLQSIERLQDGLYVSYLAVLRIEYESRTFACAYEQLKASVASAAQVLSFLF